MPNRILRDWTDSAAFDGLSPEVERLFVRILMKVDDFGRFHANPKLVKSACFPLSENLRSETVGDWIAELANRGLVACYTSGTSRFLAVRKFRQRARAESSKFPAPDGQPPHWLPSDDGQMTVTCQADARHPRSEAETEAETEAYAKAGAGTAEIPTRERAISGTMTAGILPDFAGYVFDDWESRGGKDGGGNLVPWIRYVTKRWAREGTEWRNGTHSALKRQKTPSPHAVMGTPHDLKAKTL